MACDYTVRFLKQAVEEHGFGQRWSYWDAIHDTHYGLSASQVRPLYPRTDALINLCGATAFGDEHPAFPVRIMIHTGPAYRAPKNATLAPKAPSHFVAHTP